MHKLHSRLLLFPTIFLAACASQPQLGENDTEFTIDELKQRAEIASYSGAHRDALLQYHTILTKEPDNVEALIGAGESLLAAEQSRRAENYFDRALKSDKLNLMAREGRALSWLMQGNYSAAQGSFKNLVDDGVEHWRVWNGLGVVADLFGNYTVAHENYRKAIALSPERAMLHNNLGYSQIMAHDYAGAEDTLKNALLLNPGNARVLNNFALSIAWQGRYEEAIDALNPVMGAAAANNNIGYVAYLRKEYVQAKELFVKAMRLRPSYYIKAANNLKMVNRKLSLE